MNRAVTNNTSTHITDHISSHISSRQIAIVGGGIMGISLGYYLSRQGVQVDIYEASPILGGLAGPLVLDDGTEVDRFYHAILSSDGHLQKLCQELDIAGQMRFRKTRMGFYYDNAIYSMNGVIDFLRFPPLGWTDRFRLGLTIMAAQLTRDWQKLEHISVQEWLLRWSGHNTYEHIWRPMLNAKFDGGFEDVPATWIWSRLVRMKSTRDGASQKEEAGHLIGGYKTLMQAMARRIEEAGGNIYLRTPVEEIAIEGGCARGLRVNGMLVAYDGVVGTVQAPIFSRLVPNAQESYRRSLTDQEYLGIICPLMVLDKPLTDYWTINITDQSVPFTGIIETTAYIDPQYVGGYHLVYLPKYTAPNSRWQSKSDDEITTVWMDQLSQMFPRFDRASVKYFMVHRERFVEPLHGVGGPRALPEVKTPITGLYLATTSQIYPALTNGESVSRHAMAAAETIMLDNASRPVAGSQQQLMSINSQRPQTVTQQ